MGWEEEAAAQREEQEILHRVSSYAVAIEARRIPDWLLDMILGVRSD